MVWLTMFSVSSFVLARLLAPRRHAAEADTARRNDKCRHLHAQPYVS
jgi:hypothetical protein